MTDTKHTPLGDAAQARLTETEGLPVRKPGAVGERLRAIAAIHALADYLAAHPDVPTPAYLAASCWVAGRDEVAAVGTVLGTRVYAGGQQTELRLPSAELETVIIVSAGLPDRPL